MTSSEGNWGEASATRRARRRRAIRAAILALAVMFVLGVHYIPVGKGGEGPKIVALGFSFITAAALLGWMSWREADEIQRRLAVNVFAVIGGVCMFLLPVSYSAGQLLGIANPQAIILLVAIVLGLTVFVIQRFRS